MTGTINRIENHGTIISVWIESAEGGTSPIFFDHSAFRWLLEGEQCTPAHGGPMMSIIGQHFMRIRQHRHLSVTDLARRCDFRNLNKGHRRIESFEMTGCVHPNLLSKLAHELGVSNATIHDLMMEDRRRFIQRWSEWASERIEPYVIIKLMPAVYHRIRFPQTTTTLEDAEVFASAQALRFTRACCLVWTRRLSVWFDASGIVYSRTEAVPDEPNIPTMRLRSSRRNLLMDNAGFRLIEAPPTPPLKCSEDGLI